MESGPLYAPGNIRYSGDGRRFEEQGKIRSRTVPEIKAILPQTRLRVETKLPTLRSARDGEIKLRGGDGEIPAVRYLQHRHVENLKRFRHDDPAASNDAEVADSCGGS